jgi:apolipoprotein N-acyltransferase
LTAGERAPTLPSPAGSGGPSLSKVADAIIILWGWRRLAAALLAGALSALAQAPFDAFPLLWLTVPVFVWLIDGATAGERAGPVGRLIPAFAVGWTFGFGYFVGGLWWIGAAFLVDADQFAWLMPFAVIALPAGLALFWGVGAAVARALWPEGWPRIVVFAVVFAVVEWLRGHLLTGFPWNALGYALTPTPLMMQSAALIGVWGLTLAAWLIFAAPAALTGIHRRAGRGQVLLLAFAAVLFLAHLGFGAIRLALASDATVPGVKLRIVQPAIDQSEKWMNGHEEEIMKRYLEMSDGATSPDRSGVGSATHVIWPESAFPFFLTERPDALAAIAALLPLGTTLITGAARPEPASGGQPSERAYNSVFVIAHGGEILAAYDKVHLVPFGEYLPFRSFFESLGIRQLIALPGGFSPGPGRRTIEVPNAPPMGPLICYEIIFPGAVVDPANRPAWLLNLTNDAWYGDTPGPRQHFLQARVRAVEEGLPVVRAANSGISAIIDAYGRVSMSLGVGRRGILDGQLPVGLYPTIYGQLGDSILLVMVVLGLSVALLGKIYFKLEG